MVTLGSFATAYVLWKGGYDVFSGVMTIGTLNVFLSYSMSIFEPIRDIARIFADLQSSQAAAERVITMMETEPDIQDTPEVIAKYGTAFEPKRENWEPIVGDIEFKNVSFQYKKGEKVLKNFNLKVKHGQTIALVGETGSGKSTIVNLICRFYEPTERTNTHRRTRLPRKVRSSGCTPIWVTCCKRRTFSPAQSRITSATAT